MPELPEVEVLVRHLLPQLLSKVVRDVRVQRARTAAPSSPAEVRRALRGATFVNLTRRAKYLLFDLQPKKGSKLVRVLGHLGMTGRMYLLPRACPPPKHAAAVLDLGGEKFVFEDTRYFGRFTLDISAVEKLGPEPLETEEPPGDFARGLKRSSQAVKVKLLDQTLVAGLGNIYASEALFLAGISPRLPARKLTRVQTVQLWKSIRKVLAKAIEVGATIRLAYYETGKGAGLRDTAWAPAEAPSPVERFYVYGRAGEACLNCGQGIKRLVQAARSTFYCPNCQRR
ncbi:MAG: DNA-formamidopyrimidine glycosylase [Verrucomicrobia bacterium]|nr:MAG: DNA-formamidopyrimidine glycosylase [Verrucomicrobiota bacterium]